MSASFNPKSKTAPHGAVMLDLAGQEVSQVEREILSHPNVGGLIYFSRNFESAEQIADLTRQVREVRPNILIAVDQEGGRVQRFKDGFTRIPNMGCIGELYASNPEEAKTTAQTMGWLIGAEMSAVGVDFSFAPVLDIDYGESDIIGDRAFHNTPEGVIDLAGAFIAGFHEVSMGATGKHFPGHGFVAGDSHICKPVDERSLDEIMVTDLRPFERLAQAGMDAVMVAHIVYSQVDEQPAGFSTIWLQEILRQQLGFNGVIFSDDLSMDGADIGIGYVERAQSSIQAGCDMVLVCNKPEEAECVVEQLDCSQCDDANWTALAPQRLAKMRLQKPALSLTELKATPKWQHASTLASALQ